MVTETREVVPVVLRYESNVLDQQQLARIGALQAARSALVNKGPLSSGSADPHQLVSVARYIETGLDPWSSRYGPVQPERSDD